MDRRSDASSARAAGLKYLVCGAPGIIRERRGDGFIYRRPDGSRVRDAATLRRIRALVLPPAWTNVWIASDALAHLQATGFDVAGRKQYRYHASWTATRSAAKYDRLLAFARTLPAIRRKVARDMKRTPLSRAHVLATVVTLLERTSMRIGNEEYARANGSHGLTTLRNEHVRLQGPLLQFRFRGKSGVRQNIDLKDARLSDVIRRCRKLPGRMLFQYLDDRGIVRSLSSADVNSYLRAIAGHRVTAKDFRTWAGTVEAAVALEEMGPAPTASAARRNIVAAIDRVAGTLGNTRAVCRKGYIHPGVLDAYRRGWTLGSFDPERSPSGELRPAESKLMALLRRASRLSSLEDAPKAA